MKVSVSILFFEDNSIICLISYGYKNIEMLIKLSYLLNDENINFNPVLFNNFLNK